MKGKAILIGGLVYFVVTWIVGMFGTGIVIHGNILKASYAATASFWRPELLKEPPDMASLMPMWITIGLLSSFVIAFLYVTVRSAFDGPGWKKGLTFGFGMALFTAVTMAGWSGVFNLPANIWVWWAVESFIVFLIGCAAMGWATGKWAS